MNNFSSQHHSFDIALAAKYGVECAILIHHFQHWIRINRRSKKNIKEGRCWTYQSRKEIQIHFPYWSLDEVRRLCEKLVNLGILLKNNFNKLKIDKTSWYAFTDEKAFGVDEESSNNFYERQNCPSMVKNAHRDGESAQAIPDTINTDAKTKNNTAAQLADFLLKKIKSMKPDFTKQVSEKWIKDFSRLLKLRSQDSVKKIIEWIFETSTWKWNEIILSPANLLKHLDQIEMQMFKNSKTSDTKEWIIKLKGKIKNHDEINVNEESVSFSSGQSHFVIKFTDHGYKEQILNRLRKMNISVEGL